jgi:hypothetical protein
VRAAQGLLPHLLFISRDDRPCRIDVLDVAFARLDPPDLLRIDVEPEHRRS